MGAARVATIASPLQAMSLQEAVTAGVIEAPDVILIRGPRPQIDGILALADRRLRHAAAPPLSTPSHLRLLQGANEIVVGDPFSTMAHLALLGDRAERVVILEDGAAVIGARRALSSAHPSLVRTHGRSRVRQELGRRATQRLRRLAERSDATLVGGLPMSHEIEHGLKAHSFAVVRHDFAWTRHVPIPPDAAVELVGQADRIVLGSALAADGHLDRRFYRQWLERQLTAGRVAFLPHRRDEPWTRHLARELGALAVSSNHLTAELLLRDVEHELDIESFPMTAVLTLPLVRGQRPTAVRLTRLPARLWTPQTPASMIALVDDIAEVASVSGCALVR